MLAAEATMVPAAKKESLATYPLSYIGNELLFYDADFCLRVVELAHGVFFSRKRVAITSSSTNLGPLH